MKRRKARSRPQYSAPGKSLKPEVDTVFVARDLLDNIARRLDIAVSTAVVCRLALREQNADCDQDIAMVLSSVTDELQRQIERIDQITARVRSKDNRSSGGRRRKAEPANLPKATVLRVPRGVLNDVRYRLSLVLRATTVCRVALETQNAEQDVDVAATLRDAVIDVIIRQFRRIRAIVDARPQMRQQNPRNAP
jgi:cell division protein ZapA (FtsZ GTPase activity inhibitor)